MKYKDRIALYVAEVIAVNWHREVDYAMKNSTVNEQLFERQFESYQIKSNQTIL